MPCYDKKLESAREELVSAESPETDCVLTTTELEKWILENGLDLSLESEEVLDNLLSTGGEDEMDCSGTFETSGELVTLGDTDSIESDGYMSYLYRKICLQEGINLPGNSIPIQHGRNVDIKESWLTLQHGRRLHFAIVNGFRNIQGLVRKIKTRRCTYDYVEVMACPSGCLNGGGQLPVNHENKDELNYRMNESLLIQSSSNLVLSNAMSQCYSIYKDWIHDGPGSQNAMLYFSTTYKERKLLAGTSNIDW